MVEQVASLFYMPLDPIQKNLPQNQAARCYIGWNANKESLRKENP